MNDEDLSVGERIARARTSRGWSQTELGRACDIAPTQISRYEAGRAVPRRTNLAKISEALAVRYQWLTSGAGAMDEYGKEYEHPGLNIWIDGELSNRLQNYAALSGLTMEEALMGILDFPLSVFDHREPSKAAPEDLQSSEQTKMRLASLAGKVKILR